MIPESSTLPTCECACMRVCVWREKEHCEVMTPESSTLPTRECVEGGGAVGDDDPRVINTTYM